MPKSGEKRLVIFPLSKMIKFIKCQYTVINLRNMENVNLEEMKVIVLDYVTKEYLDEVEKEITYDTPLISSGYIDSFSMVSLLVFLEKKFKIKIPPSKATPEAFDSVNKIVSLASLYLK